VPQSLNDFFATQTFPSSFALLMSSFIVVGFFGLTQGNRQSTVKPGRDGRDIRVFHNHYVTSIQCADGSAAAADLRVYSPFKDALLPDETVAFIIAKGFAPLGESVQLDTFYLSQVPGDPSADSYDDSVPNVPIPFIFAIGQVSSGVSLLPGTKIKCFSVALTEYIRDDYRSSTIVFVLCSFLARSRLVTFLSVPALTQTTPVGPVPLFLNNLAQFMSSAHSNLSHPPLVSVSG
jgi:hypothetical protein